MNIEGFCQTNGHTSIKFSHVCISNICKSLSRLMCVKCVEENIHNHAIQFYKSFTEFMKYYKDEKLSQLEYRDQYLQTIQVKSDDVQKIYQEFSSLESELYQSNFKQQQDESIEEFHSNLVTIKQVIQNFINELDNEVKLQQQIYEIYQKPNNANLNNTNNDQEDDLLESNNKFLEKEIEINDIINNFEQITLNNPNHNVLQNALQKVTQLCNKLLKLNKYIKFDTNYEFTQICQYDYEPPQRCSYKDQISAQGRYLASPDQCEQILYIRDLIQKKRLQFHFYNMDIVKFDNKWKYFVCIGITNLYYFVLQHKNQIKLFKTYDLSYKTSEIEFINLNKIIIVTKNQQQIQIIDFQLRKRNFYLDGDKKYVRITYGQDKQIIVALIDGYDNFPNSINIYKETENQPKKPFIVKNHRKIDRYKYSYQIKLFNQDTQLLTADDLFASQWQIDYVNQNIILLKYIKLQRPFLFELALLNLVICHRKT